MKNCIVAQSGGPTVAINASLSGVIRGALESDKIDKIYGGKNGIQGILEEKLVVLNDIFGDNNNGEDMLKLLESTPSMYLGSCRYKMKDYTDDSADYDRLCQIFEKYDIGYFFYIGGNDSMDTVAKLSVYTREKGLDVKVVGIPKTIDNDLMCIDHTPGFGSAAKFIAATVLEMAHDTYIYHIDTVLIVEIMGRNAGWLTAAASLARNSYSQAPHLIYLPEKPFDKDDFVNRVKDLIGKQHHVIVAVSEGIKDAEGKYISAQGGRVDQFGHVMLSGTGEVLKQIVLNEIGCKCRSVELNVLQRAAAHLASETDIDESICLGKNGVKLAMEGKSGVMSTIIRDCDEPYKVHYDGADISMIANKEKTVPLEWISEDGTDVNDRMERYLRPLIQGEKKVNYVNGIPEYIMMH